MCHLQLGSLHLLTHMHTLRCGRQYIVLVMSSETVLDSCFNAAHDAGSPTAHAAVSIALLRHVCLQLSVRRFQNTGSVRYACLRWPFMVFCNVCRSFLLSPGHGAGVKRCLASLISSDLLFLQVCVDPKSVPLHELPIAQCCFAKQADS